MEQIEVGKFNLVQRAKAILLSPSDEWKIIANYLVTKFDGKANRLNAFKLGPFP